MSKHKQKIDALKNLRTPGQAGEYAEAGAKAVRPKDAATLIIIRKYRNQSQVLMGKRAASHKFMPNKFVFPGGRVDVADGRLKTSQSLRKPVLRRLQKQSRISEARLRGLALAAIRETFEETGLVIGTICKNPPQTRHPEWRDYFAHGVEPPLKHMDFIARAITPTYRTRRFDTRFFMIDASHIHSDPDDTSRASGELSDLHWISTKDAVGLDLPAITREIIKMVEARLKLAPATRFTAATPFTQFRNGKPVYSLLS